MMVIAGWGTLSQVSTLTTFGDTDDHGSQNIQSTALTIALLDLGKERKSISPKMNYSDVGYRDRIADIVRQFLGTD